MFTIPPDTPNNESGFTQTIMMGKSISHLRVKFMLIGILYLLESLGKVLIKGWDRLG